MPFYKLFADDVQAYIHTDPREAVGALSQMCLTIDVFSSRMAANRLILNPLNVSYLVEWPQEI